MTGDWWSGDSGERYWMEATDRADLGGDLKAPQFGSGGQSVWHYELVSHTQPGDIVFHWHTKMFSAPALVGWSEVIGPLRVEDYEWVPHAGTAAATSHGPQPNWMMPLGGITLLDTPITIRDIEELRDEVLAIRDALQEQHGTPVYYPFNGYGSDSIRAAQAYFSKLPRSLVELLASRFDLELSPAGGSLEPDPIPGAMTPGLSQKAGQGYMLDAAKRGAVESWAVKRAVEFYKGKMATNIEVLGKPYDLRLQIAGEEVHIEVKGSTGEADAVLVTINEVTHARTYSRVELVVVDCIEWAADADGTVHASGGRLRHWPKWEVSDESLAAKAFRHELPPGGIEH